LMRQMIQRLTEMGFSLRSGFEFEYYLVDELSREPAFEGIEIFWSVRNDFDPEFTIHLLDCLSTAGVDVITANAEYGPGQMEINYAPAVGINSADQAFTFRNAVKEVALQHGYMASFMTKPYADHSASGCHFHQSLLDRR